MLAVPPRLRALCASARRLLAISLVPASQDCGPLLFFVSSVERFCLSTAVFRFITPSSQSFPQIWIHRLDEDIFGMTMDREWNERFQKTLIFPDLLCTTVFCFLLTMRSFFNSLSHGDTEERQKPNEKTGKDRRVVVSP
jgi:hypothetical protein